VSSTEPDRLASAKTRTSSDFTFHPFLYSGCQVTAADALAPANAAATMSEGDRVVVPIVAHTANQTGEALHWVLCLLLAPV